MRATERDIRRESEPGFDYCRVAASGHAAAVVQHSWVIRAARCQTAVEALLPDSSAELYFNLGPTGRRLVDADTPYSRPSHRSAWVVGPHMRVHFLAKEVAASDIVAVRLQPGVIPALLGVPGSELRDRVVDLDTFWGRNVAGLLDRLFHTSDLSERMTLLERELERRARAAHSDQAACVAMLRDTLDKSRLVSVGALARWSGLAHRRIIALFDQHVGLKPKEFHRVQRLRAVFAAVAASTNVSWSRIAHQQGYCDQAHLNNEFRQLTGLTPVEYLARRSRLGEGTVRHRMAAQPHDNAQPLSNL